MNRYACMIRAVNVGGRRKMKMAELRALCGRLGLADVQTYLQSGNLIAGTSLGPEAVSRLGPSTTIDWWTSGQPTA